MKTGTAGFNATLASGTTSFARILTITRTDGVIKRFTDSDRNVVNGILTYLAEPGFTMSAITTSTENADQGVSIEMAIDDTNITLQDIRDGSYVGATTEIAIVKWDAPSGGKMVLFGGEMKSLTDDDQDNFSFEIRGIFSGERFIEVDIYSPVCRAQLGDSRCRYNIDSLKLTGQVSAVISDFKFTLTSIVNGSISKVYWNDGTCQFTSGANNGVAIEVAKRVNNDFTLVLPAPLDIQVGDTVQIWPGCDKTLGSCRDLYNNVINFQGEPFIPSPDGLRVLDRDILTGNVTTKKVK